MSLLLLLGNIGFAEATQSKAQMEDFKKIFKSGTHNGIIEGQNCSWKCQEVNGDFVTQITGYNFKNGTTFCQIFARENLDKPLIYNANAQNLRCIDEIYGLKNPTADNLLNNNLKKDIQIESAIEYAPNDSKITLSKFLTSLVTLNPDIIDREKTSQLGQLTLKDGLEQYSVESIDKPDSNRGNYEQTIINQMKSLINSASDAVGIKVFEDKYNKTSAIDGFNKNNMAYFNDLFINMEKIYQHLQILLFIVVGGFYLSSIGANKLQTYLESRGESESNQPYLHKFYIPLLMVGTFFMPIPEANGLAHSTIVQNTIRYFTIQSTEIADMASAIGGKTYMDKIYKSIGGINSDGIESLYNDWRVAKYTYEKGIENYEKTCKERYSKLTTQDTPTNFMRLSDKQKEELSQTVEEDRNQKAGTEYDITIGACMQLESQINSAKKKQEFLEAQFSGIQDFMNGNRESEELKALDLYFAGREKQLGWMKQL